MVLYQCRLHTVHSVSLACAQAEPCDVDAAAERLVVQRTLNHENRQMEMNKTHRAPSGIHTSG